MLICCILQTPIHADTTIENGIKQFQQFINNNLPSAYLGTPLTVDGRCGPLTKTAAVKLIQYYLNGEGANISVDGSFGPNSQNAFSRYANRSTTNHPGYIRKGDSGDWVRVLQGLLYCHNYNPGGFDGSYGTGGGTGCLYATNQFKFDNWIYENTSGEDSLGPVGLNTMLVLTWKYAGRTIQDGLYYLKNAYSNKYLTSDYSNRNIIQHSKYESTYQKEDQLWKVTYVGNGRYCLRSCGGINFSLASFVGGNVGIYDIGLNDNLSTVTNGSAWNIYADSLNRVTISWYADNNKCVQLGGNTGAEGANVVTDTDNGFLRSKWILEPKETKEIRLSLYYEMSFNDYCADRGLSPSQIMQDYYNYAWYPFRNTMGYIKTTTVQRYPFFLYSDNCKRGSYNHGRPGFPDENSWDCCTLTNHDIESNGFSCGQCKCIVRFLNTVNDNRIYLNGFTSCMYLFDSCGIPDGSGIRRCLGNSRICGTSSVIKCNMLGNASDYSLSVVRSIQHELSHNLGANHSSAADSCRSRCIMNSGLDYIRDYSVKMIWCNRCLGDVEIYKF